MTHAHPWSEPDTLTGLCVVVTQELPGRGSGWVLAGLGVTPALAEKRAPALPPRAETEISVGTSPGGRFFPGELPRAHTESRGRESQVQGPANAPSEGPHLHGGAPWPGTHTPLLQV